MSSDEMQSSASIHDLDEARRRRGSRSDDGSPEVISDRFGLSDTGNANRFALQHGEHLRYCSEWKRFLVWDNCRWVFDHLGEVWLRAEQTALGLKDNLELHPNQDLVAKFVAQSCDSRRQEAMVKMGKWRGLIPVRAADFDRNPMLFNTSNGTVDFTTGEVYEPRKEDLLLKYAPVVYDPDALCPRWLEFLETVFAGDQETIAFVRRAVGYSLCGSVKERAMFILYGTGRNGKSTLIETIQTLVGDYGGVAPIELLLSKKMNADSERLFAPLTGVRFLSVSEPEQNDRLAMGRIKRMTGNDTLVGRFLYGEIFKYRPQFKIWLLTNHPPNLNEVGPAVAERLKLIPFLVEIPTENIDRDLQEYFRDVEMPGIFNWALQGAREWERETLGECPAVSQATATMIAAADLVKRFTEECCAVGPLLEVGSTLLFTTFTAWCKDNREYSVKSSEFRERLKKLYKLESPKSNGSIRVWHGIGLNAIGGSRPGDAAVESSREKSSEWDDDKPLF